VNTLLKPFAIAAFLIATLVAATPASAQSWGRGGAYAGAAPELNAYRRGSGTNWCNWSVASTCSRWRANGNKSYGLGCTGPNDMRSGCVAERAGLR